MKSAVKILLLFLLLIVVLAGLSIYWTWFQLIPSLDKTVRIDGLEEEVTVIWDEFQIPHITAGSESDAYAVMGYLHARDRLWQMNRQLYKLEGLHTQMIDRNLLDLDRFYLTMNFGAVARDQFRELPERDQRLLAAYAMGINAFIDNNEKRLPLEFTLSNTIPLSWEPWHAIGVQLLWSWEQQQAFWTKPALFHLNGYEDDDIIRLLTTLEAPTDQHFDRGIPTADSSAIANLTDDWLAFARTSRSAQDRYSGTGFAMSTQSPEPFSVLKVHHESALQLPDQGYEMIVEVQDRIRAGITIPGFPVMLTGQNESVSWALMPLPADDGYFFSGSLFEEPVDGPVDWKTDIQYEELLSDDVQANRRILTFQDGSEYQLVTFSAKNRPVVAHSVPDNRYLAFDWTGFDTFADFGAYHDLALTRTLSDLEAVARRIHHPAVQILATDKKEAGLFPAGNIFSIETPFAIHDGTIPADVENASSLFPSTVRGDGRPVFFLESWRDVPAVSNNLFFKPWDRADRYLELFSDAPFSRLPELITDTWIQDVYSPFAASLASSLVSSLESVQEGDTIVAMALPYLQNWNHEYRANETAATLFEVFLGKSAQLLYRNYMDHDRYAALYTSSDIPISAVSLLLQEPEHWPASHSMTYSDWIHTSMKEAVRYLISTYGEEPHAWQWNPVVSPSIMPVLFDATTKRSFPARAAARSLFKTNELHVSGAPHTIHASHTKANEELRLTGTSTLKRIMKNTPHKEFHGILSTGQSGNVFSDHFDDQNPLWQNGNMRHVRIPDVRSQQPGQHDQLFIP
ncbi:penicillin acylase family protein [Balneolales bacterium ANBcel1]|nr:penicillin acylase family protein [Balneolales bacterium ANBcel1]